MLDDGSEELFEGIWPFIKRALILFLPIWVFLICWTMDVNIMISAIAAGLSLPLIQVFEKMKLKHQMNSESDSDNVIK
ncbi:MAG: hypothetical protein OSB33_06225 [Candidatus Poseidoniales archaeon]|nr:hypothetical protein [Candidatus Poseidoniales archaeon]